MHKSLLQYGSPVLIIRQDIYFARFSAQMWKTSLATDYNLIIVYWMRTTVQALEGLSTVNVGDQFS